MMGSGKLAFLAKLAYRMARIWLSRKLNWRPPYLPILLLFLTNRCNLKCQMCGYCEQNTSENGKDELSTEQWKAVLDSGHELGAFLVSMTGGEALLRPDIFEILSHAKSLGMSVHLCSNGTLINEEIARKLDKCGVDSVSVSIESHDKDRHEELRGNNSYKAAVTGIELLLKHTPKAKIGINYCITAKNFRDLSAMVTFAEELGVHQLKFAPIHTNLQHRHRPLEGQDELVFSKDLLGELEVEIKKLKEAVERSKLDTTSTMFLDGIPSLYSDKRNFFCFAGYVSCAVNPKGMVTPCCDMDSSLSVKDKTLEDIWFSEEFEQMRERVCSCSSPCWDTTNAELSLRLKMSSLWRHFGQTWKDIGFYISGGKK